MRGAARGAASSAVRVDASPQPAPGEQQRAPGAAAPAVLMLAPAVRRHPTQPRSETSHRQREVERARGKLVPRGCVLTAHGSLDRGRPRLAIQPRDRLPGGDDSTITQSRGTVVRPRRVVGHPIAVLGVGQPPFRFVERPGVADRRCVCWRTVSRICSGSSGRSPRTPQECDDERERAKPAPSTRHSRADGFLSRHGVVAKGLAYGAAPSRSRAVAVAFRPEHFAEMRGDLGDQVARRERARFRGGSSRLVEGVQSAGRVRAHASHRR